MSEIALTQKSKSNLQRLLEQILPYILAVIAAFAAAGIFIALMGFNVLEAYRTILTTSFKSTNGLVQTLLKFIPLILMALAFTIPFRAGKFNIGGEGQFIIGATGAAIVGILFADLPLFILLPLVLIGGIVFGAFWASIAGWLLYRFGVHEI